MTVALITNKHEAVIPQLERVYDKDKILGGNDLIEFLKLNIEKNIFFKRLVLAHGSILDDESTEIFSFLRSYIENYSPNMEVVFLYDKEHRFMAEEFEDEFKAPIYTPVLLKDVTTVDILESYFSSPIIDLKAKHINDLQETRTKSVKNGRLDRTEQPQKTKKETKKKGFFGSLVGGFKKKNISPSVTNDEDLVEDDDQEKVEEVVSVQEVSPEIDAQAIYIETEDSHTFNESSDALNFSEFGNEHFQTGYIDEEEEEEFEDNPIQHSTPKREGDGEGFVGNFLDPSLASSMSQLSNTSNTPQSIDLQNGFSIELPSVNDSVHLEQTESFTNPIKSQNKSHPLIKEDTRPSITKYHDSFVKIPPTLILVKGITIFIGEEAPRFVAHYINTERDFALVEIGSREVGNILNVSTNKYTSAHGEEYSFLIDPSQVNNYLNHSKKKTVIVCKDIQFLANLYQELSLNRTHTYVILSSSDEIASKELLAYEEVDFMVAKSINKGAAIFIEGINPKLNNLVETGVFSRISWKRMVA